MTRGLLIELVASSKSSNVVKFYHFIEIQIIIKMLNKRNDSKDNYSACFRSMVLS